MIEDRGADFSISDVARTVGVTRQTVYRYFRPRKPCSWRGGARRRRLPRTPDRAYGRCHRPREAVAEAVATALEWLPREKYIGLIMVPGRSTHVQSVTSDIALRFARDMVGRLDVDWAQAGFDEDELGQLSEHLLRIIQSFVLDPGRPPRHGDELRGYLRRWVGNAILPH